MPFMGPLPHSEAGLELRPGASSPLGMVGQGGASRDIPRANPVWAT
jgi:hypothetical protein